MSEQLDRIEKHLESQTEVQKDQTKAIVEVEKTCSRLVTIIEGDEAASVDGFGKRLKNLEKKKNYDKVWRIIEALGLSGAAAYFGFYQ